MTQNNIMNIRYLASQVINQVTDGHSLSECLEPALKQFPDPRDRGLLQAICFGVCRLYSRLDVILSYLLKKPMQAKDSDVHALLLVGLYQLIDMRIPEHAAVSETVNATAKFKKAWSRGFVNAVLREYLRNKDSIAEKVKEDDEAHYAHPAWWINAVQKAWPEQWQKILNANNEHPPFSLRVNLQHGTRDENLEKLRSCAEKGDDAGARHCEERLLRRSNPVIIPYTQSGLILSPPVPVEDLPGFPEGDITVQDGAAQLAAELMDLQPNQRVLDACAAPGGKLTHILEIQPSLEVVAIEKDSRRMESIKANLKRAKADVNKVTLVCGDANNTNKWWDKKQFDRILLDAPCSASGVIRRHPDIKLLRQSGDFSTLAKQQLTLLNSLWPLLKEDGLLVYVTCSIFPQENVKVVKAFLLSHQDAKEKVIEADWGIACKTGRQILPGMHNMDGFYYACFYKMKGIHHDREPSSVF